MIAKSRTFKTIIAGLLCVAALPVAAQVSCNSASEGYLLDWNTQTYPGGALSFNTNIIRNGSTANGPGADPIGVGITFSDRTETLDPGYPVDASIFTGGKGATAQSLGWINDFAAMDDRLTITITFSEPVYNLTYEMFDMDLNNPNLNNNTSGGFRDDVTVTGYSATGATVLPRITTPYNSNAQGQTAPSTVYVGNPIASNRAIANTSNGNGASGSAQDLGNMIVTFPNPVKSVSMRYGTRSTYFNTTNPGRQAMALYDLDFCSPKKPSLTYDKNVKIHSELPENCGTIPGTADPEARAAVPGSCFQYDIDITNIGSGTSNKTTISDILSDNMIFAGATVSGFNQSDPGFAFTTPAPMADCGLTSCLVRVKDAILASGAAGKIIVRTILK